MVSPRSGSVLVRGSELFCTPLAHLYSPPMSEVTVTGVDFATVFVKDYEAAKKFYGGPLGLESSVDYGKTAGGEFETGNPPLQVMDGEAIGRPFEPSGHPIALHVEDVEAARAELESKGVEFLAE